MQTAESVRAALLEEFGEGARLLVVAPRKVTSFAAESAEVGRYRDAVGRAFDLAKKRTTVTGARGEYRLPALPPGNYTGTLAPS